MISLGTIPQKITTTNCPRISGMKFIFFVAVKKTLYYIYAPLNDTVDTVNKQREFCLTVLINYYCLNLIYYLNFKLKINTSIFYNSRTHFIQCQQPAAMYRQKIELWVELDRVTTIYT